MLKKEGRPCPMQWILLCVQNLYHDIVWLQLSVVKIENTVELNQLSMCQCYLCVNVIYVSMLSVCQCYLCVNVIYVSVLSMC